MDALGGHIALKRGRFCEGPDLGSLERLVVLLPVTIGPVKALAFGSCCPMLVSLPLIWLSAYALMYPPPPHKLVQTCTNSYKLVPLTLTRKKDVSGQTARECSHKGMALPLTSRHESECIYQMWGGWRMVHPLGHNTPII